MNVLSHVMSREDKCHFCWYGGACLPSVTTTDITQHLNGRDESFVLSVFGVNS